MIQFGTDGIRGVAGQHPCTAEVAVAIGRAAVRLAGGPGARVLVARDTRESGVPLEMAVASGIWAAGGVARLAGVAPTSALATGLAAGLAEAGVMLTASHNPAEDNGFKVFGGGGRKLSDEENRRVEAWIAEVPVAGAGRIIADDGATLRAFSRALAAATPERSRLSGKKLAIDLANGAAVAMIPWLRAHLPAELVFVGAGDGAINAGVGSLHPEVLGRVVREQGCDAGFAVDGDADRCALVDERGEIVPGDALLWLLARGRKVSGLAATIMSNAALEAGLPGVRVVRTDVGDRYVAAAMAEHGLPLGGEESGHVLFDDALVAGDGLVTGLRALAVALDGGRASDAFAGFVPFPRRIEKVKVGARPALSTVPALVEAVAAGEETLGAGGRVFLRYSGTEPVLRVLVEGRDADAVGRVTTAVVAACRGALS